jgi:hypothetical protein
VEGFDFYTDVGSDFEKAACAAVAQVETIVSEGDVSCSEFVPRSPSTATASSVMDYTPEKESYRSHTDRGTPCCVRRLFACEKNQSNDIHELGGDSKTSYKVSGTDVGPRKRKRGNAVEDVVNGAVVEVETVEGFDFYTDVGSDFEKAACAAVAQVETIVSEGDVSCSESRKRKRGNAVTSCLNSCKRRGSIQPV